MNKAKLFGFFFLILGVFQSCCRQNFEGMPITNNPEIIGYNEEWKPDTNEPWWKVSLYETLKNCSEDNNK
jgi:hypothetical protein